MSASHRHPWLVVAIVSFLAFVLFTWLTATYDLAPICPDGTSTVGFSQMNQAFRNATEALRPVCKPLSKLLGYLAMLTAAGYAMLGAVQLVRGRRLAAVDKRLFVLAGLYAATFLANFFFEHILTINLRPVFEADGTLEASYPSSHSLMAVTVFGSSMLLCRAWLSAHGKQAEARLSTLAYLATMLLLVVTRACAGVHWLTDIIGGALLGTVLLSLFALAIYRQDEP